MMLPITRTHTRQWVQVFPIPVTRQGKWVPAGKITRVCNILDLAKYSHKQQHKTIVYKHQHIANNNIYL